MPVPMVRVIVLRTLMFQKQCKIVIDGRPICFSCWKLNEYKDKTLP
jgi:hypothetical protein